MNWFFLAFISMLFMAFNSLVFAHLENKGVPSILTIFIFKLVACLCVGFTLLVTNTSASVDLRLLSWLFILGALSNIGDLGQLFALGRAPNPGYALGIIFTFPVIIGCVSWMFPHFDADLSLHSIAGMIISVWGAMILATSKRNTSANKETVETPKE